MSDTIPAFPDYTGVITLRRLCEVLELDYDEQWYSVMPRAVPPSALQWEPAVNDDGEVCLERPVNQGWVVSTDEDGNEVLTANYLALAWWLATVDANRVAHGFRAEIRTYQCDAERIFLEAFLEIAHITGGFVSVDELLDRLGGVADAGDPP